MIGYTQEVKKKQKPKKFWACLEQYTYQKISKIPVRWEWLAMGVVVVVVGFSIASGYGMSPTLSGEKIRIIEEAALQGDYETARELFEKNLVVLGRPTELEEKVYPAKILERRIAELERKLIDYPENREIYLMLEVLYGQIENPEKASEYREKARVLDPNSEIFK